MAKRMAPEQETIKDFKDWLKTMPKDQLLDLLTRAYWHQKLRGTELQRFFHLFQKGVDMRYLPKPGLGKLKSPYGCMTVNGKSYKNGHVVKEHRLKGVRAKHYVHAHWIKLDLEGGTRAKSKKSRKGVLQC